MLSFVAISPLLILVLLIGVMRRPAFQAAVISLFVTLILAIIVWGLFPVVIGASMVRGTLVSLEILLIIFGALTLLRVLEKGGVVKHIELILSHISPDKRVQSILIAWFFVAFIEGAAGFGTPAALAAPLLVSLGFHPITAVTICLIGDAVPVTFGAVGLPVSMGIWNGLTQEQQLLLGENFIRAITSHVVLFHLLISSFVPLLIVAITSKYEHRSWSQAVHFFPLAFLAGLCLTVPMYVIGVVLGPEFPSLLGSLVGLGMFILILIHVRIPGTRRYYAAHHLHLQPQKKEVHVPRHSLRTMLKVFSPYIVVGLLLVATRLNLLYMRDIVDVFSIRWSNIFGTDISHAFSPFYSPGFIFLVAALYSVWIFGLNRKIVLSTLSYSFRSLLLPAITIFSILGIVQIFVYSHLNVHGYPSMPLHLAQQLSVLGNYYPLVSPFLGVMGAFIAGSATVSNLLLTELQAQTAQTIGVSMVVILSLQAMGSSIGNMIAIHNIVAASATVHAMNKEYQILRTNIIISFFYALVVGLIGFVISFL